MIRMWILFAVLVIAVMPLDQSVIVAQEAPKNQAPFVFPDAMVNETSRNGYCPNSLYLIPSHSIWGCDCYQKCNEETGSKADRYPDFGSSLIRRFY